MSMNDFSGFAASARKWMNAGVIFFALHACLAIVSAQEARSEEGRGAYSLGIFLVSSAMSSKNSGQIKMIVQKMSDVIMERHRAEIKVTTYTNPDLFRKDILNRKLDLILTAGDSDMTLTAVEKPGYIPIIGYEMFNKENKYCMYAKGEGRNVDVGALKGKKIILRKNRYDYYTLRKMINDKPDDFFSYVGGSSNFGSFFYSLSLGETDAALSTSLTYEFFRISNPGPVKGLKGIVCEKNLNTILILKRRELDKSFTDNLIHFLLNAHKDSAFKEFRSLLNMTKFRFVELKEADWKAFVSFFSDARKKGWDKDFDVWSSYQD